MGWDTRSHERRMTLKTVQMKMTPPEEFGLGIIDHKQHIKQSYIYWPLEFVEIYLGTTSGTRNLQNKPNKPNEDEDESPNDSSSPASNSDFATHTNNIHHILTITSRTGFKCERRISRGHTIKSQPFNIRF